MIKLAVTEDNLFALNALEEKLSAFNDIHIVHRARNGSELLDLLLKNTDVQLVLMDIEMPVLNGIETTAKLKLLYPNIKVVMLTIYEDDEHIFNAIKAGADSYILKETKSNKIYEAINDTLNGGSVMSPSIALKTLQLLKSATKSETKIDGNQTCLSEREIEILEQLSKGFANKRVAENLFISPFTVKRHIENIYKKLQAHNRIELLEKARESGYIH